MNKTFNAFFKLNKCTEISKFRNLAFYDVIYMEFLFKVNPRIFRKMLK